jgi:hypothetical protein
VDSDVCFIEYTILWFKCRVYYLRLSVTFQIKGVCILPPRLLRVRVWVAPRGHISGIIFVYQAAEDKPNGTSVGSGPKVLRFDVRLLRWHSGSNHVTACQNSNSPTSKLCYSTLYNIISFSANTNNNTNTNINTGCFLTLFVITNIYNKKTCLNGIVNSHRKTEKVFFYN